MNAPTKMDYALAAAAKGRPVFPVEPGGKEPRVDDWPAWATTDEARIRAWWDKHPHDNIGIATGRGFLAIDVDQKNGKDGAATLLSLELDGFDLPTTGGTRTPNGAHMYFATDVAVANSAGKIGPGIDVRGVGGYVLAPGSVVDGKPYLEISGPLAKAPAWVLERCNRPRDRKAQQAAAPTETSDRTRQRAVAFLRTEAPVATIGRRNDAGYRTAARLKDLGVDPATCLSLMTEHWRCEPPLDHDELQHVVNSAFQYGKDAPGVADPATDFKPIADAQVEAPAGPGWLVKMNARYAVTNHHGRTMVHEVIHDHELGHPRHEWISFEDLRRRHLNEQVQVTENTGRVVWRDLGSAWLEHQGRRQYEAEAFLPARSTPDGVLNLWRGFAIAPARGGWAKLDKHVRDIICNGDGALYDYVIGWTARLFQQPGEPGQTALVIQGGEGTGKGTFVRALLDIIGQHALHISQPKHLTGSFNAHLRDKILTFADEAFFAGDPSHRGPLYALITENRMQVEGKGVDVKTARNVMHIIMATNADWAVPAGVNARRFCVLKVNEQHRQDVRYFSSIRSEMEQGGLAAMLHDLLAYDLSDFDVFAVPQTDALAAQKIQSLKGPEAWLHDCLQRGWLGAHEWTDRGLELATADAYGAYKTVAKDFRDLVARDIATWARLARGALGSCWSNSRRSDNSGVRINNTVLRGLTECRHAFEKHVGHALKWETDAATSPQEFPRGGSNVL